MNTRRGLTRRGFLGAAGVAASVPVLSSLASRSRANAGDANDQLRLAWIGVGGRGSGLLRHALNLVSDSRLTVAAICDIDPAARDRAVQMCAAMKPDPVDDYRKLLDRKDVDVIFVATPIHLHAEHAVAVMQAGKHCYCEKPLGRNPQEVKAVYDAVKKAGKKFQVGFQWRYHEGFLALVGAVQGGHVGAPCLVLGRRHISGYPTEGWYGDPRLSGDLIVEQAVHEMNIFCWMLKSPPLRAVACGGINALRDSPPGRALLDHYAVSYDFPAGVTVNYTHCVFTPGGFGGLYQEVYGTQGRGVILDDTVRLAISRKGERVAMALPRITNASEIRTYVFPDPTAEKTKASEEGAAQEGPGLRDATEFAIQSLATCIREDLEPLANVDAGRNATLMAVMGRTSLYEKRSVEWKEVAG